MTDENVLISLRRVYSKDETIAAMNVQIFKLEDEIKYLKSQLIESENKFKDCIKENGIDIGKLIKKDERWKIQKEIIRKLDAKNYQLRKDNANLIYEILQLKKDSTNETLL